LERVRGCAGHSRQNIRENVAWRRGTGRLRPPARPAPTGGQQLRERLPPGASLTIRRDDAWNTARATLARASLLFLDGGSCR
jgi:hypothetical protein